MEFAQDLESAGVSDTDVKGIEIQEKNLLISQFADATAVFVKDALQIPIVVVIRSYINFPKHLV